MSLAELRHGRGALMSAHELTVTWPLFFAWQTREAKRQAEKRKGR